MPARRIEPMTVSNPQAQETARDKAVERRLLLRVGRVEFESVLCVERFGRSETVDHRAASDPTDRIQHDRAPRDVIARGRRPVR